ncbi:heme NO-binding domain-containing protein [Chitinophaga sp.]|uniref:heme NO-binding domain-containing protein n=1 Tax=Chitinophaga sp. TaxID=1869181 RepID=UPI0031E051F3
MKGIIFNITESFITERFGDDVFDEIIESCSLTTREPFVSPGTYSDEDFIQIVTAASRKLNISTADFFKQLGHFAFFKLAGFYPQFVQSFSHPKEFLQTVDSIIHVEVRKLYSDTYLPVISYSSPAPNVLVITYFSQRKLYALMEGLIAGVADYFEVPLRQTHTLYQRDGKEYCDFELTF